MYTPVPCLLILVAALIGSHSNCSVYSGTVAGAREAFFNGVPSLSLSYHWYLALPYNCNASFGKKGWSIATNITALWKVNVCVN